MTDWKSMWKHLRLIPVRLAKSLRGRAKDRRTLEERARFWAELREGEREAEARSNP